MEGLCLKGGDFETGITGLSNRSLHTANKFIKLAFAMMRNETLYYPRTGNPLMIEKEYYQGVWDKMKPKLAPYLCDHIPQDNYLTKIQSELEEKYDIKT